MGDLSDVKAKLLYFLRSKYYNSLLTASKEYLTKFKSDVSIKLFHALALMQCNRIEESINELESIKSENDTKLASIIALMYANKLLKIADKDLFLKLDSEMRDVRKTAEPIDFYHSAIVLFVLQKLDKAIDYLDKALSLKSSLLDAYTLKGWILLCLRKNGTRGIQNMSHLFELVLKENKKDLSANLGLVESYAFHNKFDEALSAINKVVVRFPDSNLPLITKMELLLGFQEWEQAIESMNRIINVTNDDLDALRNNIIILLCRDANYEEAVVCIENYVSILEKKEAKNGKLILNCAQLFSKICGRNKDILKITFKMVEKIAQVNSENVDFIVELGYQSLLMENVKDAIKYFKSATKIDESSFNALLGLTLCEYIEHGANDQVKKQIDFLLELEESQKSSQLLLLRAQLSTLSEEALKFLKRAADIHILPLKSYPYSHFYLQILNPDLILNVAKEYLHYTSITNIDIDKNNSNTTTLEVQNILMILTKACPGLYEALYLLAKLQFFTGDLTNSMNNLDKIITQFNDKSSDAYLLLAHVQVHSGLYERASQNLEIGLSHDFSVRDNPIYHYIKGLVEKNTNNYQDAVSSLTMALSLINDKNKHNLTLTEEASIYIEMIEMNNIVAQTDEAIKLLEEALVKFRNTPEEARILILSADHAVKRRNIQEAIDLLNKIKPEETYYLKAKTKLADVYLNFRMDTFAYLQCYQEMVDQNPGSDTYILLGDAYMNILEPDDALECYKKALDQDPKDPYLISKMGKALVESHYFFRAVTFYKDALKVTPNTELKLQLADLYIQLKEYDKAVLLLMTELEEEQALNLEDLTYLQLKTKVLMLLAYAQDKSGNMSAALATLKEARDNQNRVRKRLTMEQANVPEEEIKILTEVGSKLAEISVSLKNMDQAIQFYKDAIEIAPNDINIMAALAKLYIQMNSLDACQQVCTNILKIDSENEVASVMMADIAFRKIDFDMAVFHFTQLLIKQPTNWAALVRLVEVMRRTGSIEDVPEYLTNAENSCDAPSKETGLLYCTALYQWYSGNLNSALRNFNSARLDPEWGTLALHNMIEICLNPDDEMLEDQVVDTDDSEYRDSRTMALKTADRLLKEYRQRLETNNEDLLKFKLLSNFRLLASQEKHNIESALENFISLASQNAYKDHVGPILGMAASYTLLKQTQRAKNQLKRVSKTTWNFEDAEYLEKCWLLLADHYIQSGKFDVATELVSKVLQHNKSCCKAYEYLGYIGEKEQNYRSAVYNYENAWKYGGRSNPSVGFKLAYNLMKSKNYADAIDIGQQVLKISPNYPKIKKDILDKSMNNLRI